MTRPIRLGVLTPSSNTALEPLTSALVAQLPDCTAHFSRFTVTEIALSEQALGQFDDSKILAAAELLADARVDVIGWSGTGAFPIFMGVVPGETVPRAMTASAMGLVVCIGELIGGVSVPTLAGRIADATSLAAPIIIVGVCAFCGGVAALFLKETAPSKVGKPAIEIAGAGTTSV